MDASRIKKLRIDLGLTWRGMAQLLHCSDQNIWRWETGRSKPKGLNLAVVERVEVAWKDNPKRVKTHLQDLAFMPFDTLLAILKCRI